MDDDLIAVAGGAAIEVGRQGALGDESEGVGPPLAHRDVGRVVRALLDDYGPHALAAAIATALERDALGAGSIAHLLEIRRRQQGRTPPLPLALPNRPGVRDLDVRPHPLESYDALTHTPDDPDE